MNATIHMETNYNSSETKEIKITGDTLVELYEKANEIAENKSFYISVEKFDHIPPNREHFNFNKKVDISN